MPGALLLSKAQFKIKQIRNERIKKVHGRLVKSDGCERNIVSKK